MRVLRTVLPFAVAAGLAGCKASTGEPLPREEARTMPWTYQVYDMTPSAADQPDRRIIAGGRTWHAYDAPHRAYGPGYGTSIPQALMRPIGAANGLQLYVLGSDREPYARLYSPLGADRWRVYSPTTF